jgi:hypothetical protein
MTRNVKLERNQMMLEFLEGDGKDEDCDVLMRILLENRR